MFETNIVDKLPTNFNQVRNKGIHISIEGYLRKADVWEKFRAALTTMVVFPSLGTIFINLLSFFLQSRNRTSYEFLGIFLVFFILGLGIFTYWGWFRKFSAWYLFDKENEILFVLLKKTPPVLLEIPYEEIMEIRWSGGQNGYAIIETPVGKFPTLRANEKKEGSVTELWVNIAGIEAPYSDWPITLWCPSCQRNFGHHIGTAVCPFDPEISLLDLETKGRHDPEGLSQEDFDRV